MPDSATGRRVVLREDLTLVGDLMGDGGEEAAAILTETRDGVETHHLAVVDVRDERVHTMAAATVGSGMQILGADLDGRRIVIRVRGASGGDDSVVYHLEGQRLLREEPAARPGD